MHVKLRESEKQVGIENRSAEISGEEVKEQDCHDHEEDFAHEANQDLIVVQLQFFFEVMFAEGAFGQLGLGEDCFGS